MKLSLTLGILWMAVLTTSSCTSAEADTKTADPGRDSNVTVSGEVINGYRVLTFGSVDDLNLTVYRGDYVKFVLHEYPSEKTELLLKIPALNIETVLTETEDERPYFKMKATGEYAFTLGDLAGKIDVIELRRANYRELSAAEAVTVITEKAPLIVDVRTSREFAGGHLEGALLIPVQTFQRRLAELEKYKNQPILLYCATGNRSTVASKIILDGGYKDVMNLRYGIKGWIREGLPVTR